MEINYEKIGKQFANYLILQERLRAKLWPSDEPFVSVFKEKEDGTGMEIDWTKAKRFKDEPEWKQKLIKLEDYMTDYYLDFCIDPIDGKEINRIADEAKITDEELELIERRGKEIESNQYRGYLDLNPISVSKD